MRIGDACVALLGLLLGFAIALLFTLFMAATGHAQTATPTPTNTPTSTPTADIVFATGWEFGELGPTPNQYFLDGDSANGLTVVKTPAANSDTENQYQIKFSAASGANNFGYVDVTSTSALALHFDIYVSTVPTTARRIVRFYNTFGAKTGGLLMLEPDGVGYRLKAYYEDTGNECSASLNDGTECSDVSTDCLEADYGEAECGDSAYASSQNLSVNTHYKAMLLQRNDATNPGAVRVELWVNGVERGGQSRPQGSCTDTAYACSSDADCTAPATCTTTDVVSVDRVYLGPEDAVAAATTFYLDDVVIQREATPAQVQYMRIRDIQPNGDGSYASGFNGLTGCSGTGNKYQCIDDLTAGGSNDGDTSYIWNDTIDKYRSFDLESITLAADESVLALTASAIAKQVGTGCANEKVFESGLYDGTTETNSSGFNLCGTSDTNYYAIEPLTISSTPSGAAWTQTNVNSIQAMLRRAGASAGASIRVTTATGEVAIRKPLPAVPTTLTDQNGDSEITVCITGDSTNNDSALGNTLATVLEQPDNVLQCAAGGATSLDLDRHIASVLDGLGTGTFACSARKGTTARQCDYVVWQIGINDNVYLPMEPATGGECWGSSGNTGAKCWCDQADVRASWEKLPTYCREGADFGLACDRNGSPPCAGDRLTAPYCDYDNPSTACVRGCWRDANGVGSGHGCQANELCIMRPTLASMQRRLRSIMDQIDADASNAKQVLILPPWPKEYTNQCAIYVAPVYMMMHNFFTDLAAKRSYNTVDLRAEFYENCHPWTACLRDGVHYTTCSGTNCGDELLANLIADCLEGVANSNVSCANL